MQKLIVLMLLSFVMVLHAQLPTISLNEERITNPGATIGISGSYSVISDTTAFSIEYKADADWVGLEAEDVDSSSHTFSFTIDNPFDADGTDTVWCRITETNVGEVSDFLTVYTDKTAPIPPANPVYSVDYLSTAQQSMVITLNFTEASVLIDTTGKIVLVNDAKSDSVVISKAGFSLSFFYLFIG